MALGKSAVTVHSLCHGHGTGTAAQFATAGIEYPSCRTTFQPASGSCWGTSQCGHVHTPGPGGWWRRATDHQPPGQFGLRKFALVLANKFRWPAGTCKFDPLWPRKGVCGGRGGYKMVTKKNWTPSQPCRLYSGEWRKGKILTLVSHDQYIYIICCQQFSVAGELYIYMFDF